MPEPNFFRPWADDGEEELGALPPPVDNHVVSEQQQIKEKKLVIATIVSQEKLLTEHVTTENGIIEKEHESSQNTITSQPLTVHTSEATITTALWQTAASTIASPTSVVTNDQYLNSLLPSQRTTTNSLPQSYAPKTPFIPTITSPAEAASVHLQSTLTTNEQYFFTPPIYAKHTETDEEDYTSTNSLPQSQSEKYAKQLKRPFSGVFPQASKIALPKKQNMQNEDSSSFQQHCIYSINSALQPSPQRSQPSVSVCTSPSASPLYQFGTAGQYLTTPSRSQSFTTTEGYHTYTIVQPQSNLFIGKQERQFIKASSELSTVSSIYQRTMDTSVGAKTLQNTKGYHFTTAPREEYGINSFTRQIKSEQHFTPPPPPSQSSATVAGNNTNALPLPQSEQTSERPTEPSRAPITKTESTDYDIENKNLQKNIEVTNNREPRPPTLHTSQKPIKLAENLVFNPTPTPMVHTETTHEERCAPPPPSRSCEAGSNTSTSSLSQPQTRRTTMQTTKQSTRLSPSSIPSNGMSCVLVVPNKIKRTLSTLYQGMERSPTIRSILLSTTPGVQPVVTLDQWQQGQKEEDELKHQQISSK